MPSRYPAERRSPEFPTLTAKLGAGNQQQHPLLLEEATERDGQRRHFCPRGLMALQTHDQAWEIVWERYLLVPSET